MRADRPTVPAVQPASDPGAPVVVQVEREARALLAELAALGEPLPAAPAVYGRPVLYAVSAPLEPGEADQ
jgi:hypothetical protein